jgi:hypothetical protein
MTDPIVLEVHRPVQLEDMPPGLPVLPLYEEREHDQGPDLSVLSRNLIGVDGSILRGPILACRAPAARESERVNVTA